MKNYAKIPLAFLFIGSLMGVFLRWQFIAPTSGINYSFFLHGHSHIMFLGWVFNTLYLAFVQSQISENQRGPFGVLFSALQILTVGMMISFPFQGYGFYSILFSSLHTIVVFVFIGLFFKRSTSKVLLSNWLAKVALVFFAISAVGPFSLGYIIANGLGQTNIYYFSIYFYLHFQYNGFFLFGVLSIVFSLLEAKGIPFDSRRARGFAKVLAFTCFPTYLLSVLWSKPPAMIYVIGGLSALVQLISLFVVFRTMRAIWAELKKKFDSVSVGVLRVVFAAFCLKLILQLLSAFPPIAQMAYVLRPIVIGYLHLVLIGVVSLSLMVWFIEYGYIERRLAKWLMPLLCFAFVGMEIGLVTAPWWNRVSQYLPVTSSEYLFLFSVLLSLIFFGFLISPKTDDKDHLPG